MTEKRADLLLLITAIFWGFGYMAVDILLSQGMNPFSLIGLRFLIASIFLAIIFNKKLKFSLKDIKASLIVGSALFLAFGTQTVAMNYTTTTNVSFITGINVVFVPILLFTLFKKKVEKKQIVSVLISVIGLAFLTGGMTNLVAGDMLALLCAFFFGLHIVLISFYSKEVDIIKLSIGQMFVTALLSFLIVIFLDVNIIKEININFKVLLFTGLIPSALCFLLQNIGLKYTESSRGSIILSTESLWGAIFAIVFLAEPFTLTILIGGIILFLAVLISEIKIKNKR